jgi:hypothetical protein
MAISICGKDKVGKSAGYSTGPAWFDLVKNLASMICKLYRYLATPEGRGLTSKASL